MTLLEAIREAIFEHTRYSYEARHMPPPRLRELIAAHLRHGREANWGPPGSTLAEAYMEFPGIPEDNQCETFPVWELITGAIQRHGYQVYSEPWNVAVMHFSSAIWKGDPDYATIPADVHAKALMAARSSADDLVTEIEDEIRLRGITSPIEQLFYTHWRITLMRESLPGIHGYNLVPQFAIAQPDRTAKDRPFRVDFAVFEIDDSRKLSNLKIAIECDSYTFHERSPSQYEYEKSRDRHLETNGWNVIRFAGSEVNREPAKCVRTTLDYLRDRRVKLAEEAWRNPSK
jgi:hypothetical protein